MDDNHKSKVKPHEVAQGLRDRGGDLIQRRRPVGDFRGPIG
jgi:hypothetical protein